LQFGGGTVDAMSFSKYAVAIKAALKDATANEDVTELLFNSVVFPVSLMNKTGDPFTVSKETASKLFNQLINVPREIRKASAAKEVTSSIYNYFSKNVLTRLLLGLEYDLLLKLTTLINKDNSIANDIKYGFLAKAQKNTLAEFLADVFLYTLKKDNKLPKPKPTVVNDSQEFSAELTPDIHAYEKHKLRLFIEAKGYCPHDNCGEPLFFTKNRKTIERYKATQIRSDVSSDLFENLIALCPKCHDEYNLSSTPDEVQRLYDIKDSLMREALALEVASEIKIEADIDNILRKIATVPQDELIPLNYEPVMVIKKIRKDNSLLLRKALFNITTYFNYVKDISQQLSKEGVLRFDTFATQVKLCYLKQSDKGLSQQEIYDALVEWLKTTTNGNRDACDVVISYFVQNCEVFCEITE